MMLLKQLDKSNKLKIAVLRANALGDFIFALPALEALQKTYPNAAITLLGKKWHKEFLENRPSPISSVTVIPPFPGVGELNDFIPDKGVLENFFCGIRKEKFDIAIQLQGGGKFSNVFIKNIGAILTIGLKTPDAISLDKTIPYIYYQNEYIRYLEVVGLIGATTNKIDPFVAVTAKDIKNIMSIYSNYNHPFVVLHPGASDLRRRWAPENFAKIGDFLTRRGYSVVITGTSSESIIAREVVKHMKTSAINLCGKLSLSELTGLLYLARLVISNDTGPFHLSYALKTPTIGIFWCGNMINGAPLTREKTRTLISWITQCPICNTNCSSLFPFQPQLSCKHEISFVTAVSVRSVEKTIEEMISSDKNPNPTIYSIDFLQDYSPANM